MDSAPALSPATETISANLRMVLRGLLAALGAWRIEPVIALVLYRRVSRTIGQIERMLMRFRAGQLWRVTQRETAAPGRKESRKSAIILPRRFGWLLKAGKHEAAYHRSQLEAQLNTPDMIELLAASEQAQRILRPLCRALAMELPGVIGTARKTATESGETKRRKRTPRAKPEPFRIPLPRGMLTWARREGFGKIR